MPLGTPVRLAVAVVALLSASTPLLAQQGAGDGFLFAAPKVAVTIHGGIAQPLARSDLFSFTTSELTLGRSDFRAGNIGADLAIAVARRVDLVLGIELSGSRTRSEFRDWVDNNNLPIEQSTSFTRMPITASLRYNFAERGRTVGSVAWIPARLVPFAGIGVGLVRYEFEQIGDFIDTGTLNIFSDRLTSKGWARALNAGAGVHWSVNQRIQLTGELRYLRAREDASRPDGDFVGYRLDLSGVTTLIGFTLRL